MLIESMPKLSTKQNLFWQIPWVVQKMHAWCTISTIFNFSQIFPQKKKKKISPTPHLPVDRLSEDFWVSDFLNFYQTNFSAPKAFHRFTVPLSQSLWRKHVNRKLGLTPELCMWEGQNLHKCTLLMATSDFDHNFLCSIMLPSGRAHSVHFLI